MWMQIAAKVASLPDVVLGRVLSELLTRSQEKKAPLAEAAAEHADASLR